MRRSSAWPLLLLYSALIAFASLFPFDGWRVQGVSPWEVVTAPLPPQYWTWFDVNTNVAGYVPFGLLLAIGLLHGMRWRFAAVWTVLGGALLSLAMECLQLYLPHRVPSNMDWALNTVGTALGAVLAGVLYRVGALQRWEVFRERWFGSRAHGGIALLALWPWALLFPVSVPFGLGQVAQRLAEAVARWQAAAPASWLTGWLAAWLPGAPGAPGSLAGPGRALSPAMEALCVALGVLTPCLLGYVLVQHVGRRLVLAPVVALAGVGATALSCALVFGAPHAWSWLLGLPVQAGLALGAAAALLLAPLPRRVCAVVLLLGLMWQLNLLNHAPASAYFAQTLQTWEQGRFIRFYGMGQWLGWLWPYAALGYAALHLSRRG